MEVVASLADLPPVPALAAIINCGTKWTTTLTLAAVLEHARSPVLLIDCESSDGSREHFARVARDYHLAFWWLDWPLRKHGLALDVLLASIRAERVLLVDSDLEILSDRIVESMANALDGNDRAYGAGFLHGPNWLGADHGIPPGVGYYAQRMWIPLVLLRTNAVRAALAGGASFAQRRAFVEISGRPTLSRWWTYRYWIPGLRRLRFAARGVNGDQARQPAFVEYDTGADMHAALCVLGYRYATLDARVHGGDVHHYHGMSRATRPHPLRKAGRRIGLQLPDNSVAENSVGAEIRNRLAERYGIRFG